MSYAASNTYRAACSAPSGSTAAARAPKFPREHTAEPCREPPGPALRLASTGPGVY